MWFVTARFANQGCAVMDRPVRKAVGFITADKITAKRARYNGLGGAVVAFQCLWMLVGT